MIYILSLIQDFCTSSEEDRLKNLGAEFVRSNRGGLITFHGPGQLVAYPILDLKQFVNSDLGGKRLKVLGMKWYLENLEEVVIQTLKKNFNLNAFRYLLMHVIK